MNFSCQGGSFFFISHVDKLVFDVAIGIFLHIYAYAHTSAHTYERKVRLTEVMKNKDIRTRQNKQKTTGVAARKNKN